MSDGSDFDKEAERERLREKYEKDQKKRETTQRMSELLLKGATMTNRHCDDCGDPVFRYDGQEFCPSCETPVEGGEGTTPAAEAADAADAAAPQADAPPAGENGPSEGRAPPARDEAPTADRTQTPDGRTPTADATDAADDAGARPAPRPDAVPATARGGSAPESGDDVDAARAALARSIRQLADRAAAEEDPRRARESLAAAREAAEALAALPGEVRR